MRSTLILALVPIDAREFDGAELSTASVNFVGMLIIGVIAGWLAEKATANNHSLLTNLLVGIAGSFVGGTLAGMLNIQFEGWLGSLLVAACGAILLLWIWRTVTAPRI